MCVNELNKEQEEAANFLDGICIVNAVVGAGKTKTMMERIGRLVTTHGIPPENILGITFTRNSAEEMRNRLTPILEDMAGRVMLSTIHGFCYHLLKREGYVFDILSGKDQIIFLRNIIKKLRIKNLPTGMVLSEISLSKNNLISVDEFRTLYEGDKTMLKVGDIYEAFDKETAKKLMKTFDDLLVDTYHLLKDKEEVRDKYKSTFKHILIDEFQDTTPAQIEIVKLLIDDKSNGSSCFVVGDDWQSIYSFTGASVGNILNFKDFESQGSFQSSWCCV